MISIGPRYSGKGLSVTFTRAMKDTRAELTASAQRDLRLSPEIGNIGDVSRCKHHLMHFCCRRQKGVDRRNRSLSAHAPPFVRHCQVDGEDAGSAKDWLKVESHFSRARAWLGFVERARSMPLRISPSTSTLT